MEIPYTFTARPDTGLYNGKLGVWLFLASEIMLFGALFTAYLFMRLGAEPGTWPQHVLSVPLGLTNTFILIVSSISMVYAWVALKERKLGVFKLWLAATIICGVVFLTIKGYEYYSKYTHWGVLIKETAIDKYRPEIEKLDAQLTQIPSEHAWQVNGERLEDKESQGNFVLEPVKTFRPIGSKEAAHEEKGGKGEETLAIAKEDILFADRYLPHYGTYFAIYFTVTGLHALHIIGGIVVMLYFLTIGTGLYRKNPEQFTNRIEVTGIFWHFVDLVWITVFPILYLT